MGVVLIACAGLAAQTPQQLLLARIRLHMMETLSRQPNYTCLENIERSRRDNATRKFQLQDNLRLEVALVDGKEMFAWPGSKNFEDTDLRELVPTGTFGNGNFAIFARAVFGGNIPTFEYRGESLSDAGTLIRYDFRVPLFMSGYQLEMQDAKETVGYHGSFYVDSKSLDLRRLEIFADDIPPNLHIVSASDRMEYARVKIGPGEFLLPVSSELVLVDSNHQENRNRTRFSACRQFTGESVLTFGDVDASESNAGSSKRELQLPPNLTVGLRLSNDINLDDAAVGDLIRAELNSDLKIKGQVLMAKGAVAQGRITRLDRQENATVVAVTFLDLDSVDTHASLVLTFEGISAVLPSSPASRGVRVVPPRPHEAIMVLSPGHAQLRHGTLFIWRT